MTDWHIRPARPSDRSQILALAPELLTGMAPWRPAAGLRAAVTGWVTDALDHADRPDRAVLVAVGEDAVLGFVGVSERGHFSGDREGYVGELVVDPAHRTGGIGRALLAAAEDWVRRRGVARVSLETGSANTGARAAYARLGYVEEQVTLTRGLAGQQPVGRDPSVETRRGGAAVAGIPLAAPGCSTR